MIFSFFVEPSALTDLTLWLVPSDNAPIISTIFLVILVYYCWSWSPPLYIPSCCSVRLSRSPWAFLLISWAFFILSFCCHRSFLIFSALPIVVSILVISVDYDAVWYFQIGLALLPVGSWCGIDEFFIHFIGLFLFTIAQSAIISRPISFWLRSKSLPLIQLVAQLATCHDLHIPFWYLYSVFLVAR